MSTILYSSFLALLGVAALCAVPLYVYGIAFLVVAPKISRREDELLRYEPPLDSLPEMLIQLPIYNESKVIARTLRAVAALEWPRDRLEIQVIDDSTDTTSNIIDAVAHDLRSDGVSVTIERRGSRSGFKAGALQFGLRNTKAKFVAVFDADYVPPKNWLVQAYTPMHFDHTIGFVQTGIGYLNRNENWLTRAQALALDMYYKVQQPAQLSLGLPIRFNGTCGLWRRKAIEDAGGWSGSTLAEDMDISYRAQIEGWTARLLTSVTAPGELPATWRDWRSQQYRWTKGTTQNSRTLTSKVLAPLNWWQRAIFCAELAIESYLLLIAFLAIAVGCILIVDTGKIFDLGLTIAIWITIGVHALGRLFFVALSRKSQVDTNPYHLARDLLVALSLELSIVFDRLRAVLGGLLGRRSGFVRTEKRGS